ncbi:UNVERIFIED_CONTAM: hypothetical protein Slati_0901300 [Sesamum latifolium]|uniref:Integrase catalytic domain-containing protein n=1 Tax=Sesamum latifolium TaxID=2727402 RepID=A0AAW2XTI9_9LAMI
MGGHQRKSPSYQFPKQRRNVIQEVLHASLAPMPVPRRRIACTQRNTRRILWIPCWDLDAGQQSTRVGLFWPTMKHDTRSLVNKCEKCQRHATLIHQPAEPLNVMLSSCPFSQWGVDIVGPFPLAPGQRRFLLVAIDYFTKWVEAKPLARITKGEVLKFIWKNIICRFGLPREIISDNGR